MPVSISQTVNLPIAVLSPVEPGQETVEVPADAFLAGRQIILVTCDNPHCKRGPQDSVKALSWDQHAAATDPNEVPDDAYRIINIEQFDGKKYVVCGRTCGIELLQNMEPAKSPRESNVIKFPGGSQ